MKNNKQTKVKRVSRVKRFRYWLLYKMRLISGRKYAEKLRKWGMSCGEEVERRGAKKGFGERLRYIWEYPIRLQEECEDLKAEIEELEKECRKRK